MLRLLLAVAGILWCLPAFAEVDVTVHYLKQATPLPPTLSDLDQPPEDDGVAGAELGLADNLTTGQFLNHGYSLSISVVPEDGDALAAAQAALTETDILLLDAPSETILGIAALPEASDAMLFNVSSGDRSLRSEECRGNVLHTMPSYAMRTDALVQFLVAKRWTDVALIAGTHPQDLAYAEALRGSVEKFQLSMTDEKTWEYNADMRRNASQEVPLFTQGLADHDVLLIADELGDFGRYVMYNTWEAVPLAGSEGASPVAWAPVVEQWGATQLQNRFFDMANRSMRPKDYAAWAAVRTVGEAATRTNSSEAATLRAFILSDQFELAGFKGRPLSYRAWNGQLRQPIPIVHPRAVIALAPLEGFLHQRTELDTLGLDEPESNCNAFGE